MRNLSLKIVVAFITFCVGVSIAGVWIVRWHFQPQTSKTGVPARPEVPADTLMTLQRTGCYGLCPSYTLTITDDGTVVFNATSYWVGEGKDLRHKESGVLISKVSQEQIRELIAEFEKANYFSLQDTYTDAHGCPGGIVTDSPSAYTSIQINGRSKAVSHYHGCMDQRDGFKVYPPELTELENRIDEIVNTSQWMQ